MSELANELAVCDFCPAQHAVKLFKAKEAPMLEHGAILFVADEDWYACVDCATLIEANKPIELLDHSVAKAVTAFNLDADEEKGARDYTSRLQALYWGNRAA